MHDRAPDDPQEPAPRFATGALEIALVFLVFFVHAAAAAPDVNEPHYLSRARHYWDPAWCAQDFFCNTADAHQVFYWTFGWLSRWLPLPAMAWCGRILTWGLLAWAWRRLSVTIVPGRYCAVLSAALFVLCNDRLNMAGEWVVGGVEAKGFAYVGVLLGLECLIRARWAGCLMWLGAATAMHPLVGGWSLLAAAFAWLVNGAKPAPRVLAMPLIRAALIASLGLLPALWLSWRVDPQIVREANAIYVYERLYHHLLPESFPARFVMRHLALVVGLAILVRLAPTDDRFRRLRAFLAAIVGIAAIGMAIGLLEPIDPDLAAALLRYYWFRMSDALVPLGVALLATRLVWQMCRAQPARGAVVLAALLVAAGIHLEERIRARRTNPRPPADAGIENLGAWQEACAWIAENTPADSVFLTPRLEQTFRWYAGRPEVVNYKDIPQDAPSIVEWWRRLNRVHHAPPGSFATWHESLAERGADQLRALGNEYGADYVITSAYPPLDLERVGPLNPSIAIYRLTPSKAAQPRTDESLHDR